MNIEEVRSFALSLHSSITEMLFADTWLSFRIHGKWFLLIPLDTEQPRIAVKLSPELGESLREEYEGVKPAYHMNKKHWNDLYIQQLPEPLIKSSICSSFRLVVEKLPKKVRETILNEINVEE